MNTVVTDTPLGFQCDLPRDVPHDLERDLQSSPAVSSGVRVTDLSPQGLVDLLAEHSVVVSADFTGGRTV